METLICKNCDNAFEGKFCSHCGQKYYTDKDKSFKHLADEVLHFLTHFEGNFIRTLKTVLTQPGKLSSDYCQGKRKAYYKPISFFLLIVVLYLLFPIASGMNMEMKAYENNRIAGQLIQQQIESRAATSHASKEKLAEQFHHLSAKTSKILLLLLIPLAALVIFILHITQKKYAFDYFILATEFNAFMMLAFFLILPLIIFPILILFHTPDYRVDELLQPLFSLIIMIYTFLLFRRFFMEKWFVTAIKAFAFGFIYLWYLLPLYRFIIFEVTFALT
jgi:hypothetical protein